MKALLPLLFLAILTSCEKEPVMRTVEYRWTKPVPHQFLAPTGSWVEFRGGDYTNEYEPGAGIGVYTEMDSTTVRVYVDGNLVAMDSVPPIDIQTIAP